MRLHRDVTIEIPVTVNGEGGAQAPTATEAAGAESAGAEATADAAGESTEETAEAQEA